MRQRARGLHPPAPNTLLGMTGSLAHDDVNHYVHQQTCGSTYGHAYEHAEDHAYEPTHSRNVEGITIQPRIDDLCADVPEHLLSGGIAVYGHVAATD